MKSKIAFDVAIVGAGLAGASLAHYCSQQRLRVALIDVGPAGSGGATRHSRGIVRVYDPSDALMELGLQGAEAWRHWTLSEVTPFHACGVLYIVADHHLERVNQVMRRHDHRRYPLHLLSSNQVAALAPQLSPDAWRGHAVLHEPLGGYVNPRLATQLYAHSSRRHHAAVLEGCCVTRVEADDQAAVVYTETSAIRARVAIIAAGASTPALLCSTNSVAPPSRTKQPSHVRFR